MPARSDGYRVPWQTRVLSDPRRQSQSALVPFFPMSRTGPPRLRNEQKPPFFRILRRIGAVFPIDSPSTLEERLDEMETALADLQRVEALS